MTAMLTQSRIEETLINLWKKNQFDLPDDFKSTLRQTYESESSEYGKLHLKSNLDMVEKSSKLGIPFCADTGFLAYYVVLGVEVIPYIEGGIAALEETFRRVTGRATAEIPLRPNAVHPLTRTNPGTNVGLYSPDIKMKLLPGARWLSR